MSREDLIEKYRYINVETNDWLDRFSEPFKEKMRNIGVEVREICFNGMRNDETKFFTFRGNVAYWDRFLKHMGYDDPVLIAHAAKHWKFEVEPNGYKFPEVTRYFYYEMPMPSDYVCIETFHMQYTPYEYDDPRGIEWLKSLEKYGGEDDFAKEFINEFATHMKELYDELEKEFEYLTSDEAVWETIEAKGLHEEETVRMQ